MKDLLLLLALLSVLATKVCCLPYQADSDGNCLNQTEYLHDVLDLCCKKCPPGHRLKEECTETRDTVCEPCQQGTYLENPNYAKNCLSCTKCKADKGLAFAWECSTVRNAKCVCQSGRFCQLEFKDPYCKDCRMYTKCKPGYGVVGPVKPDSDVKCEQCPDGTSSDESSHIGPCRPRGPTTSTTTSTTLTTMKSDSTLPSTTNSPPAVSPSTSAAASSPGSTAAVHQPDDEQVVVTACVVGFLLFLIIVMLLLFLYKVIWRKDTASLHPKVDANGNCETSEKVDQDYSVKSQMTSFTITSPEQEYLLEKGEDGIDRSRSSNNYETQPYSDHYTNHESISSLQPTQALNSPTSVLSDPMTLLSNTEPVSPQLSIPTQCSSQPTSPQIINPVTNNPHVNVNITLHIGNGSCGSPSFKPTDLSQAEFKLPIGQEEECFSTPEQEAGNSSKISVPEGIYCDT